MRDAVCKNCRYYYYLPDEMAGECRRYPPQVLQMNNRREWVWPYTGIDNWCGEHAYAPTPNVFAVEQPKG